MERLLANYLEGLLKVSVGDIDVRVTDADCSCVVAEITARTLEPLTPAPDCLGSLLVRCVEHLYKHHYVVGEPPKKVRYGSEVTIVAVAGPETAEVFRLLAKQFEVTA